MWDARIFAGERCRILLLVAKSIWRRRMMLPSSSGLMAATTGAVSISVIQMQGILLWIQLLGLASTVATQNTLIRYNWQNDSLFAQVAYSSDATSLRFGPPLSSTLLFNFSSATLFEFNAVECQISPLPFEALLFFPYLSEKLTNYSGADSAFGTTFWTNHVSQVVERYSGAKAPGVATALRSLARRASSLKLRVTQLYRSGRASEAEFMDSWGKIVNLKFDHVIDSSSVPSSPFLLPATCDAPHISTTTSSCPFNCHERGLCVAGHCYCHHRFSGNFCLNLPSVVPHGICGNGVVEAGEACDGGTALGTSCCTADCRVVPHSALKPCENSKPCSIAVGRCSVYGNCISDSATNGTLCSTTRCGSGHCESMSGLPRILNVSI